MAIIGLTRWLSVPPSGRTRVVLTCNLNNPTGTALAPDALDGLLDGSPDDVLVILDEAYCDYDGSAEAVLTSPARRLARHRNSGDLAHFFQGLGLAGLRYYVRHPK